MIMFRIHDITRSESTRIPLSTAARTLLIAGVVALFTAMPASGARRHEALLRVGSIPTGALVSVHASPDFGELDPRVVAGTTPVEATFDFGREGRVWLEVEHRGFLPRVVEVGHDAGQVEVVLEPAPERTPAAVPTVKPSVDATVALVAPDLTVIHRRFSREEESPEDSAAAGVAVAAATAASLGDTWRITSWPESDDDDARALRSLWRDARTVMELIDPIRLPYLTDAPRLETRSGRAAARRLGERAGADALLLIAGKQNEEKGSMVTGKIAMGVVGTATSYASAYSNATARGDSFFVYNVVLPTFAEGLVLHAVLISCADGEILWVNRGLWKPVDFADRDQVAVTVADLLSGTERVPDPASCETKEVSR